MIKAKHLLIYKCYIFTPDFNFHHQQFIVVKSPSSSVTMRRPEPLIGRGGFSALPSDQERLRAGDVLCSAYSLSEVMLLSFNFEVLLLDSAHNWVVYIYKYTEHTIEMCF